MRKYAVPMLVVPGAFKKIDPDTLMLVTDKNGNPVWDLSRARVSQMVKHNAVVKVGKKYIRQEIEVPVYRALSARDARFIRAQIKRAQRKAAEKAAEENRNDAG